MTDTLLAFVSIPLTLLSLWGWGRWSGAWLHPGARLSVPYAAALGLLAWAVVGGLADTLAWVTQGFLDALAGTGLVGALFWWWRHGRGARSHSLAGWPEILPVCLLLAATGLLAWNLLPASGFNYHDDFYRYLVNLERLIQTGTVAGDPLNQVGLHNLGIQPFFQALWAVHLPIAYVNAFDIVLCFLLSGGMIEALGRAGGLAWPVRLLILLLFVVLPPHQVNVSPIYSGTLVILALYQALILAGQARDRIGGLKGLAVAGAFAALLLGLKFSFAPFALVFLGLGTLFLVGGRRDWPFGFLLASLIGLISIWAPWMAAYSAKVWSLFQGLDSPAVGLGVFFVLVMAWVLLWWWRQDGDKVRTWVGKGRARPLWVAFAFLLVLTVPIYVWTLFDLNKPWARLGPASPVYYGGRLYHYLLLCLVLLVLAVVAWYNAQAERAWVQATVLGAAGLAALAALVVLSAYLWNGEVETLIRYLMPLVLALLPLFALTALQGGGHPWRTPVVLLLAVSIGAFVPLAATRTLQLVRWGDMLAFPQSATYRRYLSQALTPQARERVRAIQARVPPGRPLLAWTAEPFWFDFRRNPIWVVTDTARIPIDWTGDVPGELRAWALGRGISHICWQYRGPAKPWHPHPAFAATLQRWAQDPSMRGYADRAFVVFDLSAAP